MRAASDTKHRTGCNEKCCGIFVHNYAQCLTVVAIQLVDSKMCSSGYNEVAELGEMPEPCGDTTSR